MAAVLELLVAGVALNRLITRTPQVDGLPVVIVSSVAALVMAAVRSSSTKMAKLRAKSGTCPSPLFCSTPLPTPPQQQAWPRQAGSSWQQAAGTGWTLQWRSPSPLSSPTMQLHSSERSSAGIDRNDLLNPCCRCAKAPEPLTAILTTTAPNNHDFLGIDSKSKETPLVRAHRDKETITERGKPDTGAHREARVLRWRHEGPARD